MTQLQYVIKHGGLTPKRLLQRITRRGFGASIVGGLTTAAASRLVTMSSVSAAGADFTIAIIPDPQYLAASCPDKLGGYYTAMMNWIVNNRNIVFTSSEPSFPANIKAVVGVGDCVNQPADEQIRNAQAAWEILDKNRIAFTTPPGNHDYSGNKPSSRSAIAEHFASGFFSAKHRSSVYGSGIDLGAGDMAYWAGSHDKTGANTAVKFAISGVKLLILAMDFFAGNAAWSWAYDMMQANSDCECYVTTHAWLTMEGAQYQRSDGYGPDAYAMAASPYSNSAAEAWNNVGVGTWANLCGIFGGHDIFGGRNSEPQSPAWFWQHVPVKSASPRGQAVHQLFANAQQLDEHCSASPSTASGEGQTANVFLLSRRPSLGRLEGRMISTQTGSWFEARSKSFPAGDSWSTAETLLFSVPFTGLASA
jgi:hypothetical protein